jgi:hypothetical protein
MCLNESCSTVSVCKKLCDKLPIQNGLKQGEDLSATVAFQLCFQISSLLENQEGLKLNGTHQLLAYADGISIVGEKIDAIQKLY